MAHDRTDIENSDAAAVWNCHKTKTKIPRKTVHNDGMQVASQGPKQIARNAQAKETAHCSLLDVWMDSKGSLEIQACRTFFRRGYARVMQFLQFEEVENGRASREHTRNPFYHCCSGGTRVKHRCCESRRISLLPELQRLIEAARHDPAPRPVQDIDPHDLPLVTPQRREQLPVPRGPDLARAVERARD